MDDVSGDHGLGAQVDLDSIPRRARIGLAVDNGVGNEGAAAFYGDAVFCEVGEAAVFDGDLAGAGTGVCAHLNGAGVVVGVAGHAFQMDAGKGEVHLSARHRAKYVPHQAGPIPGAPDAPNIVRGVHGHLVHGHGPLAGGGCADIRVQGHVFNQSGAHILLRVCWIEIDGAAKHLAVFPVGVDNGEQGGVFQRKAAAHDFDGLVGHILALKVHAVYGDVIAPDGDEVLRGPGSVFTFHLAGDDHPARTEKGQIIGVQREIPAALARRVPGRVLLQVFLREVVDALMDDPGLPVLLSGDSGGQVIGISDLHDRGGSGARMRLLLLLRRGGKGKRGRPGRFRTGLRGSGGEGRCMYPDP